MPQILSEVNKYYLQNKFKIIPRGKLPNSSYYDVSTELVLESVRDSLNTEQLNLVDEQIPQPQQQQENIAQSAQPTNHLEVWSCVFSPDQNYFAWSCGRGLVKVMRLKNELYNANEINNRNNLENVLDDHKLNEDSSKENSPLSGSPQMNNLNDNMNQIKQNKLLKTFKKADIIEIDCGHTVWALAFGSSKSCLKHTQLSRRPPQVYRRFNFNEDRLLLAIGLSNGKIRIYDGASGSFLFCLFDHSDLVRDLKFTKDGTLQLASCSKDETVKLWNMYDDGNMYKTLKGHTGLVNACDWSPTAQLLCSVGNNRQAFIWNTVSYTISHKLKGHQHDVVTCEFSPDGSVLATGSFDTKICLWDPYTGLLIKQFFHLLPPPSFIYAGGYNGAYVRALNFSANGDHIISICDDKKIRVWSLCNKSSNPVTEASHKDGISCAYSSNSRTIMIGTRSGHIDFYEINTNVPRLVCLCRKIVNQYIERKSINELCLPNELKKFLKYEDLNDNVQLHTNNKLNGNTKSNQFQSTIAF